jgi:hypothetical protein
MTASVEPHPIGAIFDTNCHGRFDLVVYEDGLLAVKGTNIGVALRGAGPGAVGAGAGLGGAVAAGTGGSASFARGRTYEAKRLARVLESARAELVDQNPNRFIPRETIISLMLRERWYGHSLTVRKGEHTAGQRFDWKPKLNDFAQVQDNDVPFLKRLPTPRSFRFAARRVLP